MEIFPALAAVLTNSTLIFAVILAAAVGMIVGATPGLTAAAAIAMLLPITYYMDPLFRAGLPLRDRQVRSLWRLHRRDPVQHAPGPRRWPPRSSTAIRWPAPARPVRR